MRREWIGLFWLVGSIGCADPDAGSTGRLLVRAHGGLEAERGIEASRFADGYGVRYDHAYLSITDFSLARSGGGKADLDFTPRVVDLVPRPAEVLTATGIDSGRWDRVSFLSAPPPDGAEVSDVDPVRLEEMRAGKYSFYQIGALIAPDGTEIPFELGLPVEVSYFRCGAGDGTEGVVIPVSGEGEAEITWHLTHAWFDSFAEDSAFRAEAVVALWDGENPVRTEDLIRQELARPVGADGERLRDESGAPVIYIPPQEPGVSTLFDFMVRARFGHFNGLAGACDTELTVLARPAD